MRSADRRPAVERSRLYLVAPALPADVLAAVVGAGVDLVQLREKDAEPLPIMEDAEAMEQACAEAGIPFIINDRADVAHALWADGVHLGQDDLPPAAARELLGPDAIIGRSTHSEHDIRRALEEHETGWVDYIAVGPVHETPTKPGRPGVGYDLLDYAAREVPFPWFAIGGIDAGNLPRVLEAGATRVVVVRAIVQAPDPVAATEELRGLLG